jgi:putative DNA primase/helicase
MAERTNVAVVSITHFNKALAGQNGKTIYRFIGSIGFIAAARAAFVVIEDPEDNSRSLFLHAKNNLAPPPPGLAFRKTQAILDGGIVTSLAEWDLEPVAMTANQAMGESKDSKDRSATDEVEDFLREVLAIEPRPVTDALDESEDVRVGILPSGVYYVEDNGPGIDPEKVAELFSISRRMVSSYKPPGSLVGGWVWKLPKVP